MVKINIETKVRKCTQLGLNMFSQVVPEKYVPDQWLLSCLSTVHLGVPKVNPIGYTVDSYF
jgi:hypothetical protein